MKKIFTLCAALLLMQLGYSQTRILALGESTTYWQPGQYAWRPKFFELLNADGITYDMIGHHTDMRRDANGNLVPVTSHDPHHVAIPGNSSSQVRWHLDNFRTAQPNSIPDIVIILEGTNDAGWALQNGDVSGISGLIDRAAQYYPNARIIVSSIPPLSETAYMDRGRARGVAAANARNFNSQLPSLVQTKVSEGKKVTFIDASASLSLATDISGDGIHPNQSGNNKLGTAFYNAVKSTLLRNPDNPSNAVAGLNYSYYEGNWSVLPNFDALTPAEQGTVTNFDLTQKNRPDNFGFRFTGYVNVPADGVYTFYTSSDDGSKLYIGTTQVVNNDSLHGNRERSGTIGLRQGRHAITVTFFDGGYSDVLSVSYSGPGVNKQAIPASELYRVSTPSTLTATGYHWVEVHPAYMPSPTTNPRPTPTMNNNDYTTNVPDFQAIVNSNNYQGVGIAWTTGTGSSTNWNAAQKSGINRIRFYNGTSTAPNGTSGYFAAGIKVQYLAMNGTTLQWTDAPGWTFNYPYNSSALGQVYTFDAPAGQTLPPTSGVRIVGQLKTTANQSTLSVSAREFEVFAGANEISSVNDANQLLQLDQNTVAGNITVFPNPVIDGWLKVNLNTADQGKKIDVSLSDLSGREVYKSDFVSNGVSHRLNFSKVKAGVYIIRITGANTRFNAKVVVQ